MVYYKLTLWAFGSAELKIKEIVRNSILMKQTHKIRGLFVKFVEFGHKIFKYRYNPFIFLISQENINELASRS